MSVRDIAILVQAEQRPPERIRAILFSDDHFTRWLIEGFNCRLSDACLGDRELIERLLESGYSQAEIVAALVHRVRAQGRECWTLESLAGEVEAITEELQPVEVEEPQTIPLPPRRDDTLENALRTRLAAG